MTDDLDALKAALKAATPAADPALRETTLRLALHNFDRAHQGTQESLTPARSTQSPPQRAGFMRGVLQMFERFSSRQMLAGTASVAAVMVGVVALWPTLSQGPVIPAETAAVPGTRSSAAMADEAPDAAVKAAEPAVVVAEEAPPAPAAIAPPQPAPLAQAEAPVATAEAASDAAATAANDPAPEAASPAPAAPVVVAQAVPEPAAETVIEGGESGAAAADLSSSPRPRARTIPAQGEAEVDGMESVIADDVLGLTQRRVSAEGMVADTEMAPPPITNSEAFATAAPNPVKVTAEEPVSTFSIDVDTASYAIIRQSIDAGQLPPPEAVRVEEMVNYFPYAYPAPATNGAPFQPTVTVMPTPWNFGTRLVHVALQGEMHATDTRPPLNLVFLIDTSGSMDEPNKLPLLQKALALMLGSLRAGDQVAIVAYAGSAGLVLEPTAGTDTDAIYNAIDRLAAGGSTAGAEGLALAYQTAASMTADGEVSRVLLATDGDFNVGISDPAALTDYIAAQRETGIYLSVLGFGRGNLDDATMQALAQNGNGQAAYIDSLSEARKVLVDQVAGALFPIANDVKVQIEWNPAQVAEYRLIGYETRALAREDFNNDRIDAGEIGAGLQVTAIYEVTAPGSTALLNDPLRYGTATAAPDAGSEMGFLRLRYKEPGQDTSQLIEVPIVLGDVPPSDDVRFGVAIAGFGQLLTRAQYLGDWGWDDAIALANGARGDDAFGYRIEAINLMRLAKQLER